jgi:HAD superfamily phosphoserine phosphatase-like hydrolase
VNTVDIVRLPDGTVPSMYFVDLDGTLLSTSSEKYFLKHLLKKGILSPSAFLRFLSFYLCSPGRTIREGKGWNRNYLTGIPPEVIKREAAICARALLKDSLRGWTVQSIRELKSRGCETVLLSASLTQIVTGIAEDVSIDLILASSPAIVNGRFTGSLNGLRPWGKNKAELMQRISDQRGIEPVNCAAAGDSWADRFIMDDCGCSVAVCPDGRLRKLAVRRKWRIVEGRHTKWA